MTKEEVADAAWSHLSAADADKDGSISKAELESHFKQHRPHAGQAGAKGHPSAEQLFEHADKNKDGKLTKDELPGFMWTRVSTADTDKDGAISKSELDEHIKQHSAPQPDVVKPAEKADDKPAEKVEDKPAEKAAEKKPDEQKPEEKKTEEKKPEEK